MDTRERVANIMLLQKMREDPEYSNQLKLVDTSVISTDALIYVRKKGRIIHEKSYIRNSDHCNSCNLHR